MKRLAKIAASAIAGLVGITGVMYAAPADFISPSGSGQSSAPVSSTITIEEMTTRAAGVAARGHDTYRYMQHLQVIARKDKDVIKLTCVNDKLVELKPEMNIADHLQTELQTSREIGNQRATFAQVLQAADRIEKVRESADQCIGEKLLLNNSSNTYTQPSDLPDPNANPYGTEIEPPAYASSID